MLVLCLVLRKRTSNKISLIHVLHWSLLLLLNLVLIWSCSSVTQATKSARGVHVKRHSLETHLLHWINLLIQNIVDGNLSLPSWLLRRHWQMVWLVHRVLVLLFGVLFLITVFDYLAHLNLVSNTSRRLRNMVWVATLALVDVVLASSRSRIWIDTSYSLIRHWCSILLRILAHLMLLSNRDMLVLLNVAQSILLTANGIYRRQKRIVLALNVNIIAVIRFLATLRWHFWVHLIWTTLRQIITILLPHVVHHFQRILILLDVHHSAMIYFHNIWRWIFIIFNWILIISLAFAGVVNAFRHLFRSLLLLPLIHDFRWQNSLLLLFDWHLTGRFLVG